MTTTTRTVVILAEPKMCWLCREEIDRTDSAVKVVEHLGPDDRAQVITYHHPRCEDRA